MWHLFLKNVCVCLFISAILEFASAGDCVHVCVLKGKRDSVRVCVLVCVCVIERVRHGVV